MSKTMVLQTTAETLLQPQVNKKRPCKYLKVRYLQGRYYYAIPPCFNIYKKTPITGAITFIYILVMNALFVTTHSLDITVEPGTAYYFQPTTQEGNSINYVRESCSNRFLSDGHHS